MAAASTTTDDESEWEVYTPPTDETSEDSDWIQKESKRRRRKRAQKQKTVNHCNRQSETPNQGRRTGKEQTPREGEPRPNKEPNLLQ